MTKTALLAILILVGAVTAAAAESTGLGPGDKVRIVVFGEEDLSGEFELDGKGVFSMPLIGPVDGNVTGPRDLEARIAAMLRDGYLTNPKVSIEVLTYRPVYVLGEVNAPGSYPYKTGMTVLTAAAMAGGFTYRADEDEIEVSRGGSGPAKVMPADTVIRPGDIIRVHERFF
ncbi:MAG: polysaccharide biosynthesis/export family protein [Pseudomonadota bacterium]